MVVEGNSQAARACRCAWSNASIWAAVKLSDSKNLPGQDLVDFTVPRHRLGATGSGLMQKKCHAVLSGEGERNQLGPVPLIRSDRFKPQQAHRPCEFLAGLLWRIREKDPTTGP
jgi:hypothetical protein